MRYEVGQGNGCFLLDSSAEAGLGLVGGIGGGKASGLLCRKQVAQLALEARTVRPSLALGQSFWLSAGLILQAGQAALIRGRRCWGGLRPLSPLQESPSSCGGPSAFRELLGEGLQRQNP